MDDVTQDMVLAFEFGYHSVEETEPGARTRAGLDAALDVYETDRSSELARQHDGDDSSDPVLFGAVQFVESFEGNTGDMIHLCRDDDGNVLLYGTVFGTQSEVAVFDEERLRWLAGVLAAALDDWPKKG